MANMVDLIGYPKLVLNNTWLDTVYSDVDVSDDDYLVNRIKDILGVSAGYRERFFGKLSRSSDPCLGCR